MLLLVPLALLGCSEADRCDEGQVRTGDTCTPYTPSDPVPYDGDVQIEVGTTWQWQITGKVDTSHDVAVYDVDVFDLTEEVRDQLEAGDRIVLCYFSAGTYEEWRDDAGQFPEASIGKPLDDWPDERWLDHTDPAVRDIMLDRLDEAVAWNCDGVEPDNMTAYNSNSGFGLNATEQLDFNRFIADAAHERGLVVALKNDVEQIRELVDWFDLMVNEECAFYDECGTTRPFLEADKAVLHAEYYDEPSQAEDVKAEVCGVLPGLSTIIKDWDLGPDLVTCD